MIKSTVSEVKEVPELGFPKLMIGDSGVVVAFIKHGVGAVVYGGVTKRMIGWSTDFWDMALFKDFYGSVTLYNGDSDER